MPEIPRLPNFLQKLFLSIPLLKTPKQLGYLTDHPSGCTAGGWRRAPYPPPPPPPLLPIPIPHTIPPSQGLRRGAIAALGTERIVVPRTPRKMPANEIHTFDQGTEDLNASACPISGSLALSGLFTPVYFFPYDHYLYL